MSYDWVGMQRIGRMEAIGRWNSDRGVYLLYDDNTEGLAESLEAIKKHGDGFGRQLEGVETMTMKYMSYENSYKIVNTGQNINKKNCRANGKDILDHQINILRLAINKLVEVRLEVDEGNEIIEPLRTCQKCEQMGKWTNKTTDETGTYITCECGDEVEL